jgi:sulfite oxidase
MQAVGLGFVSLSLPARVWARPEKDGLLQLAARPVNLESPRAVFVERVTPTARFYVRNHFDAPAVDVNEWRLSVEGLVEAPLSLGRADLDRFAGHEVEAVLQCAGNGRALFAPRMAGVQWQRGAMGNAVWAGAKLRDLLMQARPRPEARFVRLRGADNPVMPTTPPFVRVIPLQKALHEDTLVAVSMNGAPLPPLHGGPARLVVPGWVGDDWMKWVTKIELLAEEPDDFFYKTAYRMPKDTAARVPGAPVPAEEMAPMDALNVKAVIGSPGGEAPLAVGRHRVVGVAVSGHGPVTGVEVQVNDGPWQKAKLERGRGPYGFVLFEAPFVADKPGRYRLAARATDAAGHTQPTTAAWNPSGYLYNAIDPVTVEVRA